MNISGCDLVINVDGLKVCYDDFGNGKVPVIFIHGFPFDKSSWKPQMDFLKNTNRVIAYDIRGFGKSIADNETTSMSLFADDLIKFMDALQLDKAIVCGLSMGGYILMNAAIRYPNRFKAIILSDTQCIADSPKAKEKRYKIIDQIESNGINDFASDYIKNVFRKESIDNNQGLVEKMRNVILSTSQQTITGTLKALAKRHEMCPWLGKITVPSLILCGREDTLTPFIQSEFLFNKIPNSILLGIEKAGHLSNLEQPDEFNEHLKNFISVQIKMVAEKHLIAI